MTGYPDVSQAPGEFSSRYVANSAIQYELACALKDGDLQIDLGNAKHGQRCAGWLRETVFVRGDALIGPETEVCVGWLPSARAVQALISALQLPKTIQFRPGGEPLVKVRCQEDCDEQQAHR